MDRRARGDVLVVQTRIICIARRSSLAFFLHNSCFQNFSRCAALRIWTADQSGGVWSLNPDPVGVFRGGHCILELAWRSEHLPSWARLRGTCKVYARLVGFTNIKSGRHLTLGTITSLFLGCVWLWVGIPAVQCAHRRKFKETYYWEQGRFTWIGMKSKYFCSKNMVS